VPLGALKLATIASLALAGPAAAATVPRLDVALVDTRTVVTAIAADDVATARLSVYTPATVATVTTQPAGTVVGRADALASFPGGGVPVLTGAVTVATPGRVPADQAAACLQGAIPAATWTLGLAAGGVAMEVPLYVVTAAGVETAFSTARLLVCLPAPDAEPELCASVHCARIVSLQLHLSGTFAPGLGQWRSVWTRYASGSDELDPTGPVEARADVARGAVTASAQRLGKKKQAARVSGTVTQGGVPVAGAPVTVFAGTTRASLRRLGTVRTSPAGVFSYARASGGLTFFRVTAAALPRASTTGCGTAGPLPVPCVSASVSGFSAASPVVRAR
jgi:hypothetical protein